MKKIKILLIGLTISLNGLAQYPKNIPSKLSILPPNSATLTIDLIYQNFNSLMNDPDTTLVKDKIKAQRWLNYELPKYNIKSSTNFDGDIYFKALKANYSSPLNCNNNDLAYWVPDGPDNYQTYFPQNSKQRNGWVNAIWNNPLNLNEMLVGTLTSGIMRSTNGGINWVSVTDNMNFPVLGVRQIINSPHNTNNLIGVTGSFSINGGLIYSTNGGASWSAVTQNIPSFYWVDFHPTQAGLVFGLSANGIYYSQNYGQTWTLLQNPTLGIYEEFRRIIVLPNKIFIASATIYTAYGKLYEFNLANVSTTPTITAVSNPMGNLIPGMTETNFVDFSNRVGNRFLLEAQGSWGLKVFETLNGGLTFNELNMSTAMQNNIASGGWNKNELIISPTDMNIFYWGAVNAIKKYNVSTQVISTIASDPSSPGHHVDYRCSIIINDANKDRIVLGNDGGVAIILDGKIAAPLIRSLNGNLSINLIHDMDIHPRTGVRLYAFQDNNYVYRYPNGIYSIGYISEGSSALIQHHFPTSMVGDTPYGSMFDLPGSLHPIVEPGAGDGHLYLGGYFLKYRNYPNRFARGLNNGSILINRSPLNTDEILIPNANRVGAVAICQTKPSFIYASENTSGDGVYKLFKSTNDGVSWTAMNNATVLISGSSSPVNLSNQLIWNNIRSMEVDHRNENIVYCGIGSVYVENDTPVDQKFRVIRSTDGGNTFIDYSQGLPSLPIEELLTIDSDNGLIFCANSVGVYYRTNTMSSWECYNKNLPTVEKTSLDYDYCNNMLYVATYGRGTWKSPVNISFTNSGTTEITTDQTWSEDGVINHDVIVKAGKTLTVTATMYVSSNKKIVVEPNARLFINGGHLTNLCGNYWEGVEVWGTSSQHQYPVNQPTYQGLLELSNGGSIENAINGARNWKPGDYNKIGGVIKSNGGVFKNNRRAIEFVTYRNFSQINPSITRPNLSVFSNTTFTVDDAIIGGSQLFIYHVSMWKVFGINYSNCTFNNLCTNKYYDDLSGNSAIYSIDANYFVKAGCSSQQYPCPNQNLTKSSFTGFRNAIEALNNVTTNTFSVDQAIFNNNLVGIVVKGVNNPSINRNTINVGGFTAYGLPYTTIHYGIKTDLSTNFMIEENLITGLPNNDYVQGIFIDRAGPNNTRIYKNTLSTLNIGNTAYRLNRSTSNSYIGYQALCNSLSSFKKYGINVEVTNTQEGVRGYQGDPINLISAGNTFANIINGSFGFRNASNWPINYYYNGPNSQPTISGSVGLIPVNNSNTCPTSFGGIITEGLAGFKLSPTATTQYTVDVTNLNTQRLNLEYTYTSLIDQGNTAALVEQINENWSDDAWTLRDQIIARSPNVSSEAIIFAIGKNILPNAMILEICLANPESVRGERFIDEMISVSTNSIPTYILNMIRNSWYDESSRSNLEKALGEVDYQLNIKKNLLLTSVINADEVSDNQIITELTKQNSAYVKFEQIEFYLNKNQFNDARAIVANLEYKNPEDQAVFEDVNTYINVLEDAYTAGRQISELNNSEISILDLLTTSNGLVARTAKNVLCFFYNTCYDSDVEISQSAKNLQNSSTQNTKDEINKVYYQSKVYPNPASDYSSIKWMIFEKIVNCKIKVYNVDGVLMTEKAINEVQGECIFDTRNWSSGTYNVIIENNNEKKTNEKLVIVEK